MNPPDPTPNPTPKKTSPVTLRLAAPLPDGARQRLAGHRKRLPPWWWRRLRAFALDKEGRRWTWRAGGDEPELPMQ